MLGDLCVNFLGSFSVVTGGARLLFSIGRKEQKGTLVLCATVMLSCGCALPLPGRHIVLFWLHVCRNKNAAAAAAKSEMLAKVQRAEQILEAQQKRYALRGCILPKSSGQLTCSAAS